MNIRERISLAQDTGPTITTNTLTGEPDIVVGKTTNEQGIVVEQTANGPVNVPVDDEPPIIEFGTVPPATKVEEKPKEDVNALLQQFAALQGQLSGAKQQSDLQPVLEQISNLAQSIREAQNKGQEKPLDDYATFIKGLEEKQYESPLATSQAYFEYMFKSVIAPMFQELQGTVSKTAVATAKQTASADPTNAFIMKMYGPEVEALVAKLPPGPDSYQKACAQVGMNHLSEVIDARIKEATASKQATPPPKGATIGVQSVPTGQGPKVVIIPKEYEYLRSRMDDEQIYQYLKDSGVVK